MPPAKKTDVSTTPAATGRRSPAMARPAITVEYVEALRAYSEVLFKGGLCPNFKGVASRPELVAAIIEIGKDLGLPPTQALANVMIVRGKGAIYGDAALALIRSSGLLEDIEETFEGKPGTDQYTAICRVKRRGAARDRISRFSVADAKRAGLWGQPSPSPWANYPERMLMFRARGYACRDEFGDVLCGLVFVEEAQDTGPPEPTVASTPPVTVTVPPAATLPPPSATAVQSPSPAALAAHEPATDRESLYERLAELRESMFTAKGIQNNQDACTAAWKELLANYGVDSAKRLSDAQLSELVAELAKVHEVF